MAGSDFHSISISNCIQVISDALFCHCVEGKYQRRPGFESRFENHSEKKLLHNSVFLFRRKSFREWSADLRTKFTTQFALRIMYGSLLDCLKSNCPAQPIQFNQRRLYPVISNSKQEKRIIIKRENRNRSQNHWKRNSEMVRYQRVVAYFCLGNHWGETRPPEPLVLPGKPVGGPTTLTLPGIPVGKNNTRVVEESPVPDACLHSNTGVALSVIGQCSPQLAYLLVPSG